MNNDMINNNSYKGAVVCFRNEWYFLSNFYPCKIEYDGMVFDNAEAAFQCQKCADPQEKKDFLNCGPESAKTLGKKVKLRDDWEDVKFDIMKEIVLAKFTQNNDLKRKLLNTKDSYLQEGNTWGDTTWGVCKGKGLNYLGKILMEVRQILDSSEQEPEMLASEQNVAKQDNRPEETTIDIDAIIKENERLRKENESLSNSLGFVLKNRELSQKSYAALEQKYKDEKASAKEMHLGLLHAFKNPDKDNPGFYILVELPNGDFSYVVMVGYNADGTIHVYNYDEYDDCPRSMYNLHTDLKRAAEDAKFRIENYPRMINENYGGYSEDELNEMKKTDEDFYKKFLELTKSSDK